MDILTKQLQTAHRVSRASRDLTTVSNAVYLVDAHK